MLQSKGVLLIAISMACDKKNGWKWLVFKKEKSEMYEAGLPAITVLAHRYLYLLCIPLTSWSPN